jgi:hypothetical protein
MSKEQTEIMGKEQSVISAETLEILKRIEKHVSELPTLEQTAYMLMKIGAGKSVEITLEDARAFCKPIDIPQKGNENASRSDIIYETAIEALARMKDEASNQEAVRFADAIARLLLGR